MREVHSGAAGGQGEAVSITIRTVDPAALLNIPDGTVMTFVDGRASIRRSTWTERARHRLRRALKRALWWRGTRYVVIAVSDGVVTVDSQRWSWRRLRWVSDNYTFARGTADECLVGMEDFEPIDRSPP